MNTGARLREAREARGLSIEQLARVTRVQARILQAFENDDAHGIPPRPYGRGFLRSYASQIGLDPEATVRDFFGQFASPVEAPREETTAAKLMPYVRGAGSLATWAVAIAVVVVAGRALLVRGGEPEATSTTGTTIPGPAPTTGTVEPQAPAAPRNQDVVVTVEATAPAWISASVDGTRVIYRNMQAGERETLRGRQEIALRVGDAGAVRWQVNGGPAATMGGSGQVRDARITPGSK